MIRIRTQFVGEDGSPYHNTLYFGGDTAGEADAAANAARIFWGNCANAMSTLLTGTINGEAEFVDVATGQVTGTEAVSQSAIEGFAAGSILPPANQGLCRMLTNTFVNGRRLRGRVFVPGPTEALAESGLPTATYLGYLNDGIADLLTEGAAAGNFGIYSPTHRVFGEVVGGTAWAENYAILRSRRD